ncbi:MAG: cytidylate kinase-like family protein [Candidatus Latescibacteria bacterium]|nr:cytidylate kinase-like family protein [Candidatus Latescibacterota bacterium]MCB9516191.1 cytidylate kinase-like family protein [Candidatus Latescibacterota bacterium]
MRSYRTPDLDKIVGRHLQSWELRREVSQRRRREQGTDAAQLGPYLSVSRLPYAGGDAVAARAAQLLGWELFDREIVDHIARDARVLGKFVASLDEHSRSAMDDLIQTTLDTSSLGNVGYLRHLKRVLLTLALHGNAVIVGRGANFILPPSAGLRVMVTAPPGHRLAALGRHQGLEPREAARALRELDQRRRDFLRTHFLQAGQELDHYDLIVNMEQMDTEHAATLIVDAFYTLDRRAG